MSELYINYRRKSPINVEGDKIFIGRHNLPLLKDGVYKIDDDNLLRIFKDGYNGVDPKTLFLVSNLETNNIALPTEFVFTLNNYIKGYIYPNLVKDTNDVDIISELQKLKEDAITLGEKGIYFGKLTPSNTKNYKVVDPIGFRRFLNGSNQSLKNIEEINEFYLKYVFDGSDSELKEFILDYISNDYSFIGDYLERNKKETGKALKLTK